MFEDGNEEHNISNVANTAVQWQSVVVADGSTGLDLVAGRGYFVNTTSSAITVSLPAGSAGAIIGFVDYAGTWDSYSMILSANGSEKIQGSTTDANGYYLD